MFPPLFSNLDRYLGRHPALSVARRKKGKYNRTEDPIDESDAANEEISDLSLSSECLPFNKISSYAKIQQAQADLMRLVIMQVSHLPF